MITRTLESQSMDMSEEDLDVLKWTASGVYAGQLTAFSPSKPFRLIPFLGGAHTVIGSDHLLDKRSSLLTSFPRLSLSLWFSSCL